MFAAGALDSVTSKKIRLSDSDDDLIAHNGKTFTYKILGLDLSIQKENLLNERSL